MSISPAAATVIMMLDEVRPKTVRILEMCPAAWLRWAPPGTQNHILWHTGHAVWLGGVLCIEPITGRDELPDGWAETFGMDGTPPAQTRAWPDRSEVLRVLKSQHERMKQLIGGLSDADLARVISPRRGSTLARVILHGLHDEANHQGEMYLILKLAQAAGR